MTGSNAASGAARLAVVGPGAIGASFAAAARRAGLAEVALYGRTRLAEIIFGPTTERWWC